MVSLGSGEPKALIFVLAMAAGMLIFEWLENGRSLGHWIKALAKAG